MALRGRLRAEGVGLGQEWIGRQASRALLLQRRLHLGVVPVLDLHRPTQVSQASRHPATMPHREGPDLASMQCSRVVFFGRTGEEACEFFNLELSHWRGRRVLDCPGGPGSFSALAREAGVEVMAVDPLYALPQEELERRSLEDVQHTIDRLEQSTVPRPDFNLETFRQGKLQAIERFLRDRTLHPGAYRAEALPELSLPGRSFDLVLSGHLLFGYAPLADGGLHARTHFNLAWHRRALSELMRVCNNELRLDPAHTVSSPATVHPYVAPLLADLPEGWQATLEETGYDQGFDGETPMLRLRRI